MYSVKVFDIPDNIKTVNDFKEWIVTQEKLHLFIYNTEVISNK